MGPKKETKKRPIEKEPAFLGKEPSNEAKSTAFRTYGYYMQYSNRHPKLISFSVGKGDLAYIYLNSDLNKYIVNDQGQKLGFDSLDDIAEWLKVKNGLPSESSIIPQVIPEPEKYNPPDSETDVVDSNDELKFGALEQVGKVTWADRLSVVLSRIKQLFYPVEDVILTPPPPETLLSSSLPKEPVSTVSNDMDLSLEALRTDKAIREEVKQSQTTWKDNNYLFRPTNPLDLTKQNVSGGADVQKTDAFAIQVRGYKEPFLISIKEDGSVLARRSADPSADIKTFKNLNALKENLLKPLEQIQKDPGYLDLQSINSATQAEQDSVLQSQGYAIRPSSSSHYFTLTVKDAAVSERIYVTDQGNYGIVTDHTRPVQEYSSLNELINAAKEGQAPVETEQENAGVIKGPPQ